MHFQNAMLLASLGLLPGEAAPYQRILQAVQERELGPDDHRALLWAIKKKRFFFMKKNDFFLK